MLLAGGGKHFFIKSGGVGGGEILKNSPCVQQMTPTMHIFAGFAGPKSGIAQK